MLRYLPLCLLLAACGGDDDAPAVVSDTDIAVVDAAPDTSAMEDEATDALVDDQAGDAAAVSDADAPPAPAPPAAPAVSDNDPAEETTGPHPDLVSLPGEALYYKDGMDETVIFQTGTSSTSGQSIYKPHPDIDAIYGQWSIQGNSLTFNGTTYTLDEAGGGTYRFISPNGDMVLTLGAG